MPEPLAAAGCAPARIGPRSGSAPLDHRLHSAPRAASWLCAKLSGCVAIFLAESWGLFQRRYPAPLSRLRGMGSRGLQSVEYGGRPVAPSMLYCTEALAEPARRVIGNPKTPVRSSRCRHIEKPRGIPARGRSPAAVPWGLVCLRYRLPAYPVAQYWRNRKGRLPTVGQMFPPHMQRSGSMLALDPHQAAALLESWVNVSRACFGQCMGRLPVVETVAQTSSRGAPVKRSSSAAGGVSGIGCPRMRHADPPAPRRNPFCLAPECKSETEQSNARPHQSAPKPKARKPRRTQKVKAYPWSCCFTPSLPAGARGGGRSFWCDVQGQEYVVKWWRRKKRLPTAQKAAVGASHPFEKYCMMPERSRR